MSLEHVNTWVPRLDTHTLRTHPAGPAMRRILAAALVAAQPGPSLRSRLHVRDDGFAIDGKDYPLARNSRVLVIGAGKASLELVRELDRQLGARITHGMLVHKQTTDGPTSIGCVELRQAGHPSPDARSLAAGTRALELAHLAGAQDVVILVISGGASSLLAALGPGDSLAQLQEVTRTWLHSDMAIETINAARASLDPLKAGGLARAASPARVLGLIVNDVCDSPSARVGSGPSFAPEAHNVELLSVRDAVEGAATQARNEGLAVQILPLQRGLARARGIEWGRRSSDEVHDDLVCTVAGGETTVAVVGDGKGGRNQELVLAAAPGLLANPYALLAALATDGEDGPTDAAGAVASTATIARALEAGLEPGAELARNNSYAIFDRLDDLLHTGPTLTNVCDLTVMIS